MNLIIFIVIIFASYIIPLLLDRQLRRELISPYIIFLGPYVWISCAESIRYKLLGYKFYSSFNVTIIEYLPNSLILCFIGIISFQLAYFLYKPSIGRRRLNFGNKELKVARNISHLGLIFFVYILVYYVVTFDPLAISRGGGQFKYGIRYVLYVASSAGFMPLFLSCAYFNFRTNGKFISFLTALIALPYFIVQILIGSRSKVLFPIFGVFLLIYNLRKEKITKKKLIIYLSIILFITTFITYGRTGSHLYLDEQIKSFSLIIKSLNFQNWFNSIFLRPFSSPTGWLTQMINYQGFLYGQSYLYSFLNLFLPSIIMPPNERFLSPSLFFKQIFYPHSRNLGLGFSMLAEAYLNFGLFGIPLIMGLSGLILKKLYTNFFNKRSYISLVLYTNIVISYIWWLRSDSQPFFKNVFYTILCITVIKNITIIFSKKIYK